MQAPEALDQFIARQREEENLEGLPLKDLRVVDLSTVLAAPFAATLFGDMGADVIKIENPASPDALRAWGVIEEKGIQPFWSVIGRNKFPITLNLKAAEGKAVFLKLMKKTDVLIENMRPGTMDKLGFTSDTLLETNPGLIIGKVSGYGQTGPYAAKPGFGTLAEGFSGYTYLNAQPGGVPTNAPMALADFVAGLHLAFALLVALRNQQRGVAGGQVIDVSLFEPLFGMLGPDFLIYAITGAIPAPKGNELTYVAPRNSYQTKDRQWVALSCSAQKPFERLMDTIGRPDMKDDPRFSSNQERIKPHNRGILNNAISQWISMRTCAEVLDICDDLGITVGPIVNMKDIDEDPHYNDRGAFIEVADPVTGNRLKMPNLPFRMLGSPGRIRFPGLPLGSANVAVYRDILGYGPDELHQLKSAKII
jgi:formyl-CoA transferase